MKQPREFLGTPAAVPLRNDRVSDFLLVPGTGCVYSHAACGSLVMFAPSLGGVGKAKKRKCVCLMLLSFVHR